ncbi:MAG: hypothetical protein BRC58_09545 [Cyanobacteria bacterium QS_8_64_29]|nr:MAG: hypothetical protein BRC58_09545 [Cyanobacteria bacterium QS_8_64_29]
MRLSAAAATVLSSTLLGLPSASWAQAGGTEAEASKPNSQGGALCRSALSPANERSKFCTTNPSQRWAQLELPSLDNGDSPNGQSEQDGEQQQSQQRQVLVAEVAVKRPKGELSPELRDAVYEAASVEPGRTATRSQLQEDINAIFATGWFSNVRVEPEDTPLGVRITFVVEPNPTLSDVQVQSLPAETEGRAVPPEVVDGIFEPLYGQRLNLSQLQKRIDKLNQWYKDNGYSLAQVVGSPQVSEDGTVTLRVAEGVVEDINVQFVNDKGESVEGETRKFIVKREVELSSGDVFNRQMAQQDLRRVFGLGIFKDVRLAFDPGDNPQKVDVTLNVVEDRTGSLGAGAGISSSTGFFGTASYREQNLGGNNQTLGAQLQVGTREILFDVSFSDPWIAGNPNRLGYRVNAFRQQSISLVFEEGPDESNVGVVDEDGIIVDPRVIRTGGGVTFSRPIAPDPYTDGKWDVSAGFEYQRVAIKDGDSNVTPFDNQGNQLAFSQDGTDDLFMLELRATRDLRNNPQQPTDGSRLSLSMDQSVPIGSGSILMNRLRASYSYFTPVEWLGSLDFLGDKGEALAFNVQGGTVLGDLPPYEAFVLGGSDSVRGYDRGELGSGRSFFQATAEYRFPIVDPVSGALFFDYGTDLGSADSVIGNPAGVRGKPGSGFGYGAGVRVKTPVGPVRIDFGINDEGDNQIHFGIGERF